MSIPGFVLRELDDYLHCGRLEHGFVRVKCSGCRNELLVAFSCKRRGFCPSCGRRRMVDTAAHLVDHVLPTIPIRQWVLSFPWPLRLLYSANPTALTRSLQIVLRAIETHLIKKAGLTRTQGARSGAITFIQRFGSAINLNTYPARSTCTCSFRMGCIPSSKTERVSIDWLHPPSMSLRPCSTA